jgi:hypothetical protein
MFMALESTEAWTGLTLELMGDTLHPLLAHGIDHAFW